MKALGSLLLVALVAACGGSDSSGTGAPPSGSGVGSSSSSTSTQRENVCKMLEDKKCDLGSSGRSGCEDRLAGTSSAFIQGFDECLHGASDACDAWGDCEEKVSAEIAPGFPNVLVVTQCKDKNLGCATKYTPNYVRTDALNDSCEALVKLDDASQTRAKECAAKECDAFAACIVDLAHPGSS